MQQNIVDVIEAALTASVVTASGLRLRPMSDEQLAIDIIEALREAGYEIVLKSV